jgi:hypothetical protein
MNTDGSRSVSADLSVGAELDVLPWIGIGLLVAGALRAAGAALAITLGIRHGSGEQGSRGSCRGTEQATGRHERRRSSARRFRSRAR